MIPPGPFYEGDTFGRSLPTGELVLDADGADALNYALDELRRLDSLRAVAPLSVAGRQLALDLAAVVYAKLGSGHAFTVQQFDATAGWTDVIAGETQTAAWASGGGTADTGQVVRLYNVAPGDWRYQYPKTCASVCFVLKDASNNPVAGASITLTPDSGPTVTGTTDAGGIWCPGGLAAGYWYADVDLGTSDPNPARITLKLADACCCQYTLTWTGGDPTPAPTACCKCDTTLHVDALGLCGTGHLSGVAITVTGPGGYSATQTTTGASAGLWFTLPHVGGDYVVTATWNGAQTATQTVAVTPCDSYSVTFYFLDAPEIYVIGCSGPISGATVEVVDLPAVHCTTDVNGHCTLDFSHDVPPSPLQFKVTLPTGPFRTMAAGNDPLHPYSQCKTTFYFVDRYCVTVYGCGTVPTPGATVTVSGPEDLTGTTDSSGQVCFTPAVDWSGQDVQVTAAKAYYQTLVYTTTILTNQATQCTAGLQLSPLDCYICCPSCPDPVPTSILITDINGGHAATVVNEGAGAGCIARVCYAAPSSARVDGSCNVAAGNVHVQYTFSLVPTQPAKLGVIWLTHDCTGTGGTGDPGYHPVDTSCATLQTGSGVTAPFAIDSAQVTWADDCPANPLSLSGTMPAGGLSANPVAGSVTVADNCSGGGTTYQYYSGGGGPTTPATVSLEFDSNAIWGDLAGTTLDLALQDAGSDEWYASCVPNGTVSLCATTTGSVDVTVTITIDDACTGGGDGSATVTIQYFQAVSDDCSTSRPTCFSGTASGLTMTLNGTANIVNWGNAAGEHPFLHFPDNAPEFPSPDPAVMTVRIGCP